MMKNILGLDLGVSSIGWAIIKEENKQNQLICSGVRIIPIESTVADEFSKGNSTSKNQDRRIKRAARRNLHRFKLRRQKLKAELTKVGLWPIDAALFNLSSIELYGLRHKALSEKITLQELVRIWYHLNQKRGYIDSRKNISEDEKDTAYVEKIKQRSKSIYDSYKTVGSYFYHKLKETKDTYGNPIYRVKSGDDKENIFLIDEYKHEFNLIWYKQKEFYPNILTETLYNIICNQTIYFKRKLKSQRILIGECRFEKHHKSMPVSSPIAEEVRLWQDINKIKIQDKLNQEIEYNDIMKQTLFDYLMKNEKISEADFLKLFGIPNKRSGTKLNFEKHIKGNQFCTRVINACIKHNYDFTQLIQFEALSPDFTKSQYYILWHLIYSIEETPLLKAALKKKFNFSDPLIDELIRIPIKNDFASISTRAARKLLPHLRKGLIYSDACKAVGYNHSDSITKQQNEARELLPISQLELIKPNTLRNPTVEKILNQLINLLKSINSEGYTFDEIRVELARDLKKNAKERKKIQELNNALEKRNKEITDILRKAGFNNVTRRDIEKYKLWEEFDGCSPYEPNVRIELGNLFNKALYEIEHILPKARYFDDSLNNKTIARTQLNKAKDKSTAFDYMQSQGPDKFQQYLSCINANNKISRTKREYLKTSADNIPQDFINRQLNETRYIASETLKLLKQICRNVYSTTGSVTDYLKHHWGYGDILMELNYDRTETEKLTRDDIKNKLIIKDWNKRLDHRHHALDAIIVAATKHSYINQLNQLNSYINQNESVKAYDIKSAVPFPEDEIKKSLSNILVSFKPGKRIATRKTVKPDRWGKTPGNINQQMFVPRGSLHEESVYGKINLYQKIPIAKLEHPDQLAIPLQFNAVSEHLTSFNNDFIAFKKALKKKPVKIGDKVLSDVTIYNPQHVKRYNLQYSSTNKFKLKDAEYIVNPNVRRIVINRLNQFNDKPELAFRNLKEDPLYFNRDKGIVIESVRCFTGGKDYPALHVTSHGNTLNNKAAKQITHKTPVDFVKGGSNHHIAIYQDEEGNRYEQCVSFFEAFDRKRNGLPIIQKQHPLGYRFLFSFMQNEMFVFGLPLAELNNAIEQKNYALISKHLYRVQKIQSGDYFFRHHLETQLLKEKGTQDSPRFFRISSVSSMNGIKVVVRNTNTISLAHD